MKDLTEKQRQVLEFIEEFQEREGMAPTVSEISEFFGIKSSTAFAHLKALERKKELSRSSKARSINLSSMHNSRSSLRLFSGALIIPLLGRVNAGMPSESMEFKEDEFYVDSKLLNNANAENLFALRIQGESMRDLGMYDGDIIVVERNSNIRPGDVVVALVNNEVTVKSFYPKNGNIIELHPANNDFKIQSYPAGEVNIQGRVIFLQRQF